MLATSPYEESRGRSSVRFAQRTDAQLLEASDPLAFEIVVNRHVRALHRYVGRRVQPAAVDDLVAETFAIAFDQRARYRREYPDARPWLCGIAANLVRNHRRRERAGARALARLDRQSALDDRQSALDGTEAVAVARAQAHAMRDELAAAIATLRRGDRDALLLMAWAELSYEEIAKALGIPIGTVRSRINRARRRLRERLHGLAVLAAEA
jgi:RNA polymerase sigma-70 factor, ECF subfamily